MSQTKPLTADDRLEIHELYARYGWAMGTGDIEGFVACFTPDAVLCDDVFDEVDRWVGSDSIRSMITLFTSGANFPGRQHHVSQIVLEGDAERVDGKAFTFVTHCTGEPPYPVRMAGYYTDVLVRQGGRWLFQERTIRDWSGPILKGLPGQSGKKVPRKRPPDLQRTIASNPGER